VTVACLCYPWRSIKLILRMLRTALRRAVSSQNSSVKDRIVTGKFR